MLRSQHHASYFSNWHVAIEGDFYLLTLMPRNPTLVPKIQKATLTV